MSKASYRRTVVHEDDDDEVVLTTTTTAGGNAAQEEEGEGWGHRDKDKIPAREDRPAHHCRYCYQSDPHSVVQCVRTGKWFCNSGLGMQTSCILNHLRSAPQGEAAIRLHEESPLGAADVECYICGSKNVFSLGFVQSMGPDGELEAVLLCRDPCMLKEKFTDSNGTKKWKRDDWKSLIEPGKLRTWLVSAPGKEDTANCFRINRTEMRFLETAWNKNPDADLASSEVLEERKKPQIPALPLKFVDEQDYHDAMKSVLLEEMANSRRNAENTKFNNVTGIKYEHGVNGIVASLSVPQGAGKIGLGQGIKLRCAGSENPVVGTVKSSHRDGGRIHLEIQLFTKKKPSSTTASLDLSFNGVGYKRMFKAARDFVEDESSISSELVDCVLGHKSPAKMKHIRAASKISDNLVYTKAGDLPQLNPVQAEAVKRILKLPVGLIQGPPGTGKTVTASHLVYHMVNTFNSQVLVCSPSNVACDQMCEKIEKSGLKVVRVLAISRESLENGTTVPHLSLHNLVTKKVQSNKGKFDELSKLRRLREEMGELELKDYKRYRDLASDVEETILSEADVICCTCITAGDLRLQKFRFKHVVIDEATQGIELETLVPITCGAKQVILVGDHCQMGPVVQHKPCEIAGLGRSLFERFRLLGHEPAMLTVQYRMHPFLPIFSSEKFYNGALTNGVTPAERDASSAFSWIDSKKPSVFINVAGASGEEIGDTGRSFLNRSEAKAVVMAVVDVVKKKKINPKDIGVITPYEAQRQYLLSEILRTPGLGAAAGMIEVANLDSFQGREKEFVILSCVRSSDDQGLGFISSWRRLNVALTRARRGCIIVGDGQSLGKGAPVWHALLQHYQENSLIARANDISNPDDSFKLPPAPASKGKAAATTVAQKQQTAGSRSEDNFGPETVDPRAAKAAAVPWKGPSGGKK